MYHSFDDIPLLLYVPYTTQIQAKAEMSKFSTKQRGQLQ